MLAASQREVTLQRKKIQTPNIFASYRLGDVTSAGIHFFPWKMTNTEAVLVNAYDLMENPKSRSYREKLQAEGKSIRKHIGFAGPLMIDSGAYYFIRNGRVHINPVEVLKTEMASGADIGVVLDHPFPPKAKDKQKRIDQTVKNTRAMFRAYPQDENIQLELLPVVHGHDPNSIKSTIKRLETIAETYNGSCLNKVGVGSLAPLAQNGDKELAVQVLTKVRALLPEAYIHCFSMGSALLMLLAFYCGADTVDSQTWILSAAFKYVQLPGNYVVRLATRERAANPYQYKKKLQKMVERIRQLHDDEGFFVKDWISGEVLLDPTDDDLQQYLNELTDRPGHRRIHNRACHNLWVFNFEVKRAQQELKCGKFEQFVESRLKDTRYYETLLRAKTLR